MISVVALVAFSVGVAFDVFARLETQFERLSPVVSDNVLAVLVDPGGIVRGRLRPGPPARRARSGAPRGDRATLPRAGRAGAGDHLHVEPVDDRGRGRHDLHQPAGGAPPRLHPRRVDVVAHVLERAHPLRRSRPGDRSVGPGRPRRHGVPRGVPFIAKDGRIVWVRDESWAIAMDADRTPRRHARRDVRHHRAEGGRGANPGCGEPLPYDGGARPGGGVPLGFGRRAG